MHTHIICEYVDACICMIVYVFVYVGIYAWLIRSMWLMRIERYDYVI